MEGRREKWREEERKDNEGGRDERRKDGRMKGSQNGISGSIGY